MQNLGNSSALSIPGVGFRHAVGAVADTCCVVNVLVQGIVDLASHIERTGNAESALHSIYMD